MAEFPHGGEAGQPRLTVFRPACAEPDARPWLQQVTAGRSAWLGPRLALRLWLRLWRDRSSGMTATAWGRAGPDIWSRRLQSHTGARRGNWSGTGIAARSSSPARVLWAMSPRS